MRICILNLQLILCCIVFLKIASDVRSSDQGTALYVAAGCDQTAVCQLLIDAKADVNARVECAFMFEV